MGGGNAQTVRREDGLVDVRLNRPFGGDERERRTDVSGGEVLREAFNNIVDFSPCLRNPRIYVVKENVRCVAGKENMRAARLKQMPYRIRHLCDQLCAAGAVERGDHAAWHRAVVVDDDTRAFPFFLRGECLQETVKNVKRRIAAHAAQYADDHAHASVSVSFFLTR